MTSAEPLAYKFIRRRAAKGEPAELPVHVSDRSRDLRAIPHSKISIMSFLKPFSALSWTNGHSNRTNKIMNDEVLSHIC